MATQSEGGGKDDLKTQFVTREGTYKLMTLSEYSRPSRIGYGQQGNMPVKVSFVTLNDPANATPSDKPPEHQTLVVYNLMKELYCMPYHGLKKAADVSKPVDKRMYKGTSPTCHDFNKLTSTSECAYLLVGFSAGQVQLIDPIRKETSKLFNEERLIDKSKVTCLKWIPGSPNQFLVSHSSGQMYVYNEELPCGTTMPHYQLFKQGEGFAIYTCKTKTTRNPLYRWVVGEGVIQEFAFSPCSKYLATVSQDGYLRVFNYDTMDHVGGMRSYFGGLLCVAWSPDGKFVVVGGEDDLVTVWSSSERRVVARGHGHRSWVSVVAFDEFTSTVNNCDRGENRSAAAAGSAATRLANASPISNRNSTDSQTLRGLANRIISYRFGSVGHDTHLCLWDLTEDVIRQPQPRATRASAIYQPTAAAPATTKCNSVAVGNSTPNCAAGPADGTATVSTSITHKFASLTLGDKRDKDHKRHFSLTHKNTNKTNSVSSSTKSLEECYRAYGTGVCPRLEDVPALEPLVCKKIVHERLTALAFREDCIVTGCQEGFVLLWARPSSTGVSQQSLPLTQHATAASLTPNGSPVGGTVV
ncbi:PREDICTED: WD repeat-containing protein 20-like [Priapulus caudatus]|uniref:WD repeat-containing protein 20-like n=1 Tax=Priapulus caudatus TaxID=37621 RepID=A0ABM1EA99_PRICU|nr:PREDICTED: WD repeat-containing protein 20-like [Priapulus caudatus]